MNNLEYFNGARSEKTITKRYRELAKKYHPDNATSEAELQEFTEIMKEVNAEHQEVLVLLKHKALLVNEQSTNAALKENFMQGLSSLFNLTNAQKQELAQQGKNFVNTLIH
jgi:hypothetical protein